MRSVDEDGNDDDDDIIRDATMESTKRERNKNRCEGESKRKRVGEERAGDREGMRHRKRRESYGESEQNVKEK